MTKSKSPAFQFYPKDWLSSEEVACLSLVEEGIYIRALAFCWKEGSIPADLKKFMALIGKECSEVSSRVVQGLFNVSSTDNSRLVHQRLERERIKQAKWRDKCSEAGKKSAEKRKRVGITDTSQVKVSSRLVQLNSNIASSSSSTDLDLKSNIIKNNILYKGESPEPKPEKPSLGKNIEKIRAELAQSLGVTPENIPKPRVPSLETPKTQVRANTQVAEFQTEPGQISNENENPYLDIAESKLMPLNQNLEFERSNIFMATGRRPMTDYPDIVLNSAELSEILKQYDEAGIMDRMREANQIVNSRLQTYKLAGKNLEVVNVAAWYMGFVKREIMDNKLKTNSLKNQKEKHGR